ncbi:UNVERIFIED_CONTAM: hypothetical protein HDU68_010802 [Siphonaria sp. JEL0065]|nr:hypothetical protein HDU68_010802 [Siphonaria sp. JEL0065]
MGKPDPPSAPYKPPLAPEEREVQRLRLEKLFEPCRAQFWEIPSLKAAPHLIDQIVSGFAMTKLTHGTAEHEQAFVKFNAAYSSIIRHCDAISAEDRRRLLMGVEVMRATGRKVPNSTINP